MSRAIGPYVRVLSSKGDTRHMISTEPGLSDHHANSLYFFFVEAAGAMGLCSALGPQTDLALSHHPSDEAKLQAHAEAMETWHEHAGEPAPHERPRASDFSSLVAISSQVYNHENAITSQQYAAAKRYRELSDVIHRLSHADQLALRSVYGLRERMSLPTWSIFEDDLGGLAVLALHTFTAKTLGLDVVRLQQLLLMARYCEGELTLQPTVLIGRIKTEVHAMLHRAQTAYVSASYEMLSSVDGSRVRFDGD